MGTPRRNGGAIELQSRSGARNGWGIELGGSRDEAGGWRRELDLSLSARPGDQWELSLDPNWERSEDSRQYVTAVGGGRPQTFGTRYVFAHVDRSEVAARFRLNYTFTPRLTLETYAEPFAASGSFHTFGELREARGRDLIEYGTNGTTIGTDPDGNQRVTAEGQSFTIPNHDFNVRSLRSNVVIRWEWRPGSTMFVVWQQDKNADREPGLVRPGDIFDTFGTKGDNFLAVKVSYWIPVR